MSDLKILHKDSGEKQISFIHFLKIFISIEEVFLLQLFNPFLKTIKNYNWSFPSALNLPLGLCAYSNLNLAAWLNIINNQQFKEAWSSNLFLWN